MSPPQLLLDENLSERLLPLLIERFPHSTHVRLIGLGGATAALLKHLEGDGAGGIGCQIGRG
ncbi:MAG: hypothetical protein NT053_14480 [Cyanobacteria bacterium]|nr:hypothetical protein [Cyanobacteriota bacterium]